MVTHMAGTRSPVFHAIADPTRRAILDGLATGARAAGVIAESYPVSRPAISKHLRVLQQAGLVRVVRHGRHRMYELAPAPLREVDAWLARYRLFWAARLSAIKDIAESLEGSAAGAPDRSTREDTPPRASPQRRGRRAKEMS